MRACIRTPSPPLLSQHGDEIAETYRAKRALVANARFSWPRRDGENVYDVIYAALVEMFDEHCGYCDGYPIDGTGETQVDHFRPKTRPEFYGLIARWDNLFLTCSACNKAKLDQWDELLLKPDEVGYEFERYFEFNFETGKLLPNQVATDEDQARATTTIEILDLNRVGACFSRKRTVRELRSGTRSEVTDYRFLLPLVPA